MDTQNACWQAFVRTGNILSYLDYRKQEMTADGTAAVQEDYGYGPNRNDGTCAPGDKV
ncbi:MAG: hypothetical protein LKJ90_07880 [Faecalibacterium sp.]|jgi:hypothetical protein|nr:hypothetical protein [Faecalibacterium sp.]